MAATSETVAPTEADHRERIWFFPHKFWQVTKNMPKDEAANLMAEVERYAEAGDVRPSRNIHSYSLVIPTRKSGRSSAA